MGCNALTFAYLFAHINNHISHTQPTPIRLTLYRIVGWARPTATRITSICRAGPNFMQSVVSTFPCSLTLARSRPLNEDEGGGRGGAREEGKEGELNELPNRQTDRQRERSEVGKKKKKISPLPSLALSERGRQERRRARP